MEAAVKSDAASATRGLNREFARLLRRFAQQMLKGVPLAEMTAEFGRAAHEHGYNDCWYFYRIRDWVKSLADLPDRLETIQWMLEYADELDGNRD